MVLLHFVMVLHCVGVVRGLLGRVVVCVGVLRWRVRGFHHFVGGQRWGEGSGMMEGGRLWGWSAKVKMFKK